MTELYKVVPTSYLDEEVGYYVKAGKEDVKQWAHENGFVLVPVATRKRLKLAVDAISDALSDHLGGSGFTPDGGGSDIHGSAQ